MSNLKVLVTVPSRSEEEFTFMRRFDLKAEFLKRGIFPTIDIPTEHGYGNAIRNSWAQKPGYDVYVTLDNDFAVPLKDMFRLIDKVIWGQYDVVVGCRINRIQSNSPLRGIMSRSFNTLIGKVFATGMLEHFSGFRAFSSRFVEEVLPECEEKHWMFQPEAIIVAQALGYRVTEVPVSYDSTLRPTKLRRLPKDAMDILPGFVRLVREWK